MQTYNILNVSIGVLGICAAGNFLAAQNEPILRVALKVLNENEDAFMWFQRIVALLPVQSSIPVYNSKGP